MKLTVILAALVGGALSATGVQAADNEAHRKDIADIDVMPPYTSMASLSRATLAIEGMT